MSNLLKSLGDSSDELSEGGSSNSGEARKSVICYTEKGVAYPAKLSLSSEESEEDSSVSDRNSQSQTPSRHLSSELEENEEYSLRTRSCSMTEDESLLAELEAIPQVASRYTDEDPDYAKEIDVSSIPPPVITNWSGGRSRQFQGGGRGGGGRGNQHFGDRNRQWGNRDNEGEDNERKAPRLESRGYDNRGRGDYHHQNRQHRYGGGGGSSGHNSGTSSNTGSRDGRW